MAPALTLRPAVPGDAALLADLGRRTFGETFEASNSAENLQAFYAATYTQAIQAAELADPEGWYCVAEVDGEGIGFARLRRGETPTCITGPAPIELQRIYVLRAWHGLKAGPALLARCLEEARARGARTLWLGVWERNDRALAFYRRHGFAVAGDHRFSVGADPQRDLIMVRSLE
jgi:ribosomal protein S18 acetylase RimI-like enzyme